jgi:hypothetical protein
MEEGADVSAKFGTCNLHPSAPIFGRRAGRLKRAQNSIWLTLRSADYRHGLAGSPPFCPLWQSISKIATGNPGRKPMPQSFGKMFIIMPKSAFICFLQSKCYIYSARVCLHSSLDLPFRICRYLHQYVSEWHFLSCSIGQGLLKPFCLN